MISQANQSELIELLKQVPLFQNAPERALEILAHGLTQKYLHGPMAALNQSEPEERAQLLSLLPRLMPAEKRR